MDDETDLTSIVPDRTFDGGDLDCGSGLVLLLRENMARVPVGGILEMRSREPTVRDELPPWCRMVGHELLGALDGPEGTRYFLRRGEPAYAPADDVEADKSRAKEYEWRTRTRLTGPLTSRVYCRNHSFVVGAPASFSEKDDAPAAIELLLGSLAGALASGFGTECSRAGLEVDDVEITARAKLANVLAHLGLEDGDPSIREVRLKCFASSMDDAGDIRAAWERAVARSPIAATLARATTLDIEIAIV